MAKFDKGRAWTEARQLMLEHRGSLAIGLVLMVINRLSGFVLPWTSKFLIDDIVGKHRADLLMPIAAAAAGATLVQAVSQFALSQVVSIAAQRAITKMRRDVYAHILRLPVSYFDATKSGVLISRVMTDAEGVRNLVGTGLIQLLGASMTATISVGVLFYLNWKLTLATVVVLLAFGAMLLKAVVVLRPIFRERSVITADVTGRLAESIGGIRLVKLYTAEPRERLVFTRGAHRMFRNLAKTITGSVAVNSATVVIAGVIGVIMIVFGGRAILNGTMTLGDLVMYGFFIGLMAMPLAAIAQVGTLVSEAFAGLDRIREIRQIATEDEFDASKATISGMEGSVEFEDVTFEYTAGNEVLKRVSFSAPAGSTTALVGSSGSGKSTLIGLVMAFHHPKSGRVLVDGQDVAGVRLRNYRSHLGVVMQDNFLFDGSIKENIAFSKPGATDEEIRTAASIAHCDEFVSRFEAGYETIVGERGVKLSGGQRQRVAIARAILADPRILILDEATSSLDSESESLIRDGLRSLRRGRTTFVIAHRLSTIESADQILVLENGEIAERGTHRELLAMDGRYRQLYEKQYGAENDSFINPGEDFTTPMRRTDEVAKI